MLQDIIIQMYADIDEYSGYLGDSIETGAVNPFEQLMRSDLSDFERTGMSISVLCYLGTAIDNSTYEDALNSTTAKQARECLKNGSLSSKHEIQNAIMAFFHSEEDFLERQSAVFSDVVRPALDDYRKPTSTG